MPRKMIYIREGDKDLWEKAEEFAGESLSGLLAAALREYIDQRERINGKMGRITVEVEDRDGNVTKKGFTGAWLVGASDVCQFGVESEESSIDIGTRFAVARTEGGRYVVCVGHCNEDHARNFEVFEDFEDLTDELPDDIAAAAATADGSYYVHELDI